MIQNQSGSDGRDTTTVCKAHELSQLASDHKHKLDQSQAWTFCGLASYISVMQGAVAQHSL